MPLNPDEIEAIRRARFPRSWGWRGYDKAEVEGFLERVAARLEESDTRERELEKELVRAKARRRRPAQATRARRPRSTKSAAARAKPPADLNRATFAQVRGIGLGATVSARLIALRDIRGGFRQLYEVRDVEGLSDKAFRALNRHFYVDGDRASR